MITTHISESRLPSEEDISLKESAFTLIITTNDEEFSSSQHDTLEEVLEALSDAITERWYFYALYKGKELINIQVVSTIEVL